MVAAWISADTGVGPSIASGSQMWSGNIADLPAPPMKMSVSAQAITEQPMKVAPPAEAMAAPGLLVSVTKSNVSV